MLILSPKKLHIVSFDVSYPPNYGGVIDVFYKLKALHKLGIEIIFHCFEYGRGKQNILQEYCKEVYYYERNSFIKSFLSTDPFIVKTRANSELIKRLNQDNHPVLFEGLHTTFPLFSKELKPKKTIIRAHNIEHEFYKGLAKSENSIFKKRFFKQEAKKLKTYEKIVNKCDLVLTISPHEQNYFQNKYGNHCHYIPAFHKHEVVTDLKSSEKFVLYHGNVSVSENSKAASFLIDVYKNSDFKLVIASNFENESLLKEIKKYQNIKFVNTSEKNSLENLFEKAQIHALPTFQKTGIKLKLLNTLYQGRFVIANDFMIEDTGLESLCHLANTPEEFLAKTKELMTQDFRLKERENRLKVLKKFDPIAGAKKIVDLIFGDDS